MRRARWSECPAGLRARGTGAPSADIAPGAPQPAAGEALPSRALGVAITRAGREPCRQHMQRHPPHCCPTLGVSLRDRLTDAIDLSGVDAAPPPTLANGSADQVERCADDRLRVESVVGVDILERAGLAEPFDADVRDRHAAGDTEEAER